MDFGSAQFWLAVMQIVAIDILLGGDNAVVIGLACRKLPERERKLGILWGMAGAVSLRVGLIFFAVSLLAMPYLKIVGALLLLWIGVELLQPEEGNGNQVHANVSLLAAIKTIIVADAVMSMDNVIAIAGVAGDRKLLVVFGLMLSVPIIIMGSQLVIKLMDRFPIVVVGGGALLGWIAGGMIVNDRAISAWVSAEMLLPHFSAPLIGALFVVLLGRRLASKAAARQAKKALEDLIDRD